MGDQDETSKSSAYNLNPPDAAKVNELRNLKDSN